MPATRSSARAAGTFDLPFDASLMSQLLSEGHITGQDIADWITSASIRQHMQDWKVHVFDNAQHQASMRDWLPKDNAGRVLVGATEPDWEHFMSHCNSELRVTNKSNIDNLDVTDSNQSHVLKWVYIADRMASDSVNHPMFRSHRSNSRWIFDQCLRMLVTAWRSLVREPASGFFANALTPVPPPPPPPSSSSPPPSSTSEHTGPRPLRNRTGRAGAAQRLVTHQMGNLRVTGAGLSQQRIELRNLALGSPEQRLEVMETSNAALLARVAELEARDAEREARTAELEAELAGLQQRIDEAKAWLE